LCKRYAKFVRITEAAQLVKQNALMRWTAKPYLLLIFATLILSGCTAGESEPLITIATPRTTFAWPSYIALKAGYYAEYGLRVRVVFANHPEDIAMLVAGQAQFTLSTLQQAMEVIPRNPSLRVAGNPVRKWLFALIARGSIVDIQQLKGKRIGITQLGGSTYDYAARLLERFRIGPTDVQWISLGTNAREAALAAGRIDATMLSAPSYFALEKKGYRVLANINDYDDILSPNVLVFEQSFADTHPDVLRRIVSAHAQAVRRFYEDKQFAIDAYLAFDKQDRNDLESVYETYAGNAAFDRVPYVLRNSVDYVLSTEADAGLSSRMKRFDYKRSVDNATVDQLVDDGFFKRIYGGLADDEISRKSSAVFR
jgi:ABC-type nitrate/sulfonate/bicarbonate transport system substrate-binding protein